MTGLKLVNPQSELQYLPKALSDRKHAVTSKNVIVSPYFPDAHRYPNKTILRAGHRLYYAFRALQNVYSSILLTLQ
jgi:hypothetical protein